MFTYLYGRPEEKLHADTSYQRTHLRFFELVKSNTYRAPFPTCAAERETLLSQTLPINSTLDYVLFRDTVESSVASVDIILSSKYCLDKACSEVALVESKLASVTTLYRNSLQKLKEIEDAKGLIDSAFVRRAEEAQEMANMANSARGKEALLRSIVEVRTARLEREVEKHKSHAASVQRELSLFLTERQLSIDALKEKIHAETQCLVNVAQSDAEVQNAVNARLSNEIADLKKVVETLSLKVDKLELRENLVHAIHKREIVVRVRNALAVEFGPVPTRKNKDNIEVSDWRTFYDNLTMAHVDLWIVRENLPAFDIDMLNMLEDGTLDGNVAAHQGLQKDLPGMAVSVANLGNTSLRKMFYLVQMLELGRIEQY